MNQRMNELMIQWINELEVASRWIKEPVNHGITEVNEPMNHWIDDSINPWMSDLVSRWINEKVS